MRRAAKIALVVAVIVIVIVVLVAIWGPYGCFLDLLNAQIARGCDFRPFYAGVPGLPPPREVIPALGDLEDAFPVVRAEALAVLTDLERIPLMHEAYNNIFLKESSGWAVRKIMRAVYGKDVDIFDRIGSPDWRTFNLVLFNNDVPGNAGRCPELVRLLKRIPGMQSALISILAPGARIPPHSDPAKGVIRYHLAFKVPRDRENCYIVVKGRRYSWEEGKGVLFDDVYDHWVRNDTDESRTILFVDILRPLRGRAKAVQGLANAANRYHPGVRRLIRASRV